MCGGPTSWELSFPQADLHLWSTRKVPSSAVLYSHFPYSSNHGLVNYARPFACTNYLFSSFVPSVVSLWNGYQIMLKFLPSLLLRLMYHTSMVAIHVAFLSFCDKLFTEKINILKMSYFLPWHSNFTPCPYRYEVAYPHDPTTHTRLLPHCYPETQKAVTGDYYFFYDSLLSKYYITTELKF